MNNMEWIYERIGEFRGHPFISYEGQIYQYDDLIESIDDWRTFLKENGIAPGDCIAVVGDYSPHVIFLFMALILNNNIIVPLSKEVTEKKQKFLDVSNADGIFEFNDDDTWSYKLLDSRTVHPLVNQLVAHQDPGVIIFSSGTTGESKGALLNLRKLTDKFSEKKKGYRTLTFLKLDHIGGMNTLFSVLFSGGMVVTSEDRTPKTICANIEQYRVQLLPTTPTFLNMILMSRSYRDYDLQSLEIITYGTEPMPTSTLRAINNVFPDVKLKQTYGLTELGIFSTKSKSSRSEWMKIGGKGVEIKVVDGTLWVRAEASMLGYLNAPTPFDDAGWYNTGDQVLVDGDYMKIVGRKEEIINVGGEKVFPIEVESTLLEIPGVKDAVVEGKKNPITGQIVTANVLIEENENPDLIKQKIHDFCKTRLERYKRPQLIQIKHKSFVGDRLKKMRFVN